MTENPERIKIGDRVTIFRRGKKGIWNAEFSVDGIHKRQSLKTGNKNVAVERATQLAAQLTTGQYRESTPETLIESAREQYLDYLVAEDRAPKTVVRYRGELTAFVDYCRKRRVEFKSSSFRTHLSIWHAHPESCQLILCWELDRDPTGGRVPILELKTVFRSLHPERQRQICWEAYVQYAMDPIRTSFESTDVLRHIDSRNDVAVGEIPPQFRRLAYEPSTEVETIILASLLLGRGNFCIQRAGEKFPDWMIRRRARAEWGPPEGVELEWNLTGFRSHRKAYAADPKCCSGVIGWDGNLPGFDNLWQLRIREQLETQQDRHRFCLRRTSPPIPTFDELSGHLTAILSSDAADSILFLVRELSLLRYEPVFSRNANRDGVSFQFSPGGGTETLNLFCFLRGRYIRPTLWWSTNSLEKSAFPAEPLERFRRSMGEISPTQHVTHGVHCGPTGFAKCTEHILSLARDARSRFG
jgi:hypothetical protein